jgi:type II secretory ATPase GspE/PulE/Tfp pilus assembly ATPase PilB-like protein
MLSSEGKPTDTEAIGQQVLSTTQTLWESGLDPEQIFRLIESILSFEACLYHQVLPFGLEDNKLLLGMVNSQDGVALDYATRIVSYINCTIVTTIIAPETHRSILSAYLNYKNTSQSAAANITPKKSATSIDSEANPRSPSISQSEISEPISEKISVRIQDTEHSVLKANSSAIENQDNESKNTISSNSVTTPVVNANTDGVACQEPLPSSKLPVLPVPVPNSYTPIEELTTLPPKKLLEELLGRVLAGGIGRLYLERQPYQGRILWSENGVLQSVLDKLPLSVFQGVLNELKRFTNLPVVTYSEAKHIEKECLYQQDRLLLRLRVIPGVYGEEATLQVLRGAALKFYQQQQLARLSRDALGISQQLSYKLHELQQRLILNPSEGNAGQVEAFTTLNKLLNNLDQQIKVLTTDPPINSK